MDIRIPAYHGPPDGFVYEWRTDRRGYESTPEIAARDQLPIVAVGESFTEGMGVHTDRDLGQSKRTWLGYATYNMGVQGYAPIQMSGTFQHFGMPLRPKSVIIGNLAEGYESGTGTTRTLILLLPARSPVQSNDWLTKTVPWSDTHTTGHSRTSSQGNSQAIQVRRCCAAKARPSVSSVKELENIPRSI